MPTRGTGRRTLAVPALLLALATGLAGCTGGGTAEPTPTASAAMTPSPTPTPTPSPEPPKPPTRPETMATNDEAGALAAAQYFMGDLYWYMYSTGDTAEWSALADDACIFCNNILGDVEDMVAAGRTDRGDVPTFESGSSTTITEGARFTATVRATQPPSQRVTAAGTAVDESAGGRYELHFAIAWNGDWSILAVDATSLDESVE